MARGLRKKSEILGHLFESVPRLTFAVRHDYRENSAPLGTFNLVLRINSIEVNQSSPHFSRRRTKYHISLMTDLDYDKRVCEFAIGREDFNRTAIKAQVNE